MQAPMKERANITVWGSTRVMLFEQVRPRAFPGGPAFSAELVPDRSAMLFSM